MWAESTWRVHVELEFRHVEYAHVDLVSLRLGLLKWNRVSETRVLNRLNSKITPHSLTQISLYSLTLTLTLTLTLSLTHPRTLSHSHALTSHKVSDALTLATCFSSISLFSQSGPVSVSVSLRQKLWSSHSKLWSSHSSLQVSQN